MRQTLKADLVAAVEKANERSSQLFHPSPPSTTTPPTDSQHRPTSSQLPTTAQSSCRSRSPPRPGELYRDDKRHISVPRSPRRPPRSHDPSRRRQPASPSHRGRESSVTLLSVSPDRRSYSYDVNQDDRTHHSSAGRSSRPAEPSNPPAWRQPDGPSFKLRRPLRPPGPQQ